MANRKQLKILRQGVAAWNAWREEHPDAKIDLRGAKLDGLDLSGANFWKADIRGTIFRNGILSNVNFSEARAGFSLLGSSIQFLFALALMVVLFFLMISIYISSAVILQYVMIIYQDKSLLGIIVAFIIILLFLLTLYGGIFIQGGDNKIVNIVLSVFLAIAITPVFSFFCTFIIFILLSVNDGSIQINNILVPEKLVRMQQGREVVSMGDSHVTMGYIGLLLLLLFFVLWKVWREDQRVAFVRKGWLVMTTFFGTDFRSANLKNAVFDRASLKHARLSDAVLVGISWREASGMKSVRFDGAILDDRAVRELLVNGKGRGQSFKGKKIAGAYLVEADLCSTDLRETDLMQANLSKADITGAKLYGSAREDWIIDGIRCDYVYWDEAGAERTPPDRDFCLGEFEELYKQLPTFEYIFEQGFTPLDPLIMDRVVQAINERHKEFKLDLINFDKRGQPHATFTVCRLDYIDEARGQLAVLYERTIEYLTRENDDKKRRIDKLEDYVDQLIGNFSPLKELPMGNTYNNYGQVAAMGEKANATGNIFQQITPELSRLHQEMQNKAATPEQQAATEDIAKAEQAAQQGDEPTMQQHLKNAGQWAVDCAQKVGTDVLTEYLKKLTLGT